MANLSIEHIHAYPEGLSTPAKRSHHPPTLIFQSTIQMENGVLFFVVPGKAHRKDFVFLMVQGGIFGKSPGNISTTFCKKTGIVPAQPF